ncbi:hypothetical protein ACKKBF_B16885 [Auxenochlorella protothecoides x Auxenochlorella symbiontica]
MEHRAHHDDACGCHADPAPASQSLDEMAFAASACSAAQSGDLKGLQRLYDRARSPSHLLAGDGYQGSSGYTPLHFAARAGHDHIVAWLLKQGVEVNATTTAGRATPLHRAAYMGHASICRMLHEAGASCLLRDADGHTAADKAEAQGHTELAIWLRGLNSS